MDDASRPIDGRRFVDIYSRSLKGHEYRDYSTMEEVISRKILKEYEAHFTPVKRQRADRIGSPSLVLSLHSALRNSTAIKDRRRARGMAEALARL